MTAATGASMIADLGRELGFARAAVVPIGSQEERRGSYGRRFDLCRTTRKTGTRGRPPRDQRCSEVAEAASRPSM